MTTTLTTHTDSESETLTRADIEARPIPGKLRPSALPKLAECRCYASAPGESDAAARGHAIDSLMRDMLTSGKDITEREGLEEDDVKAAMWGVHAIREIANGSPIIAAEEHLKIDLHSEVLPDFEDGSHGVMDAAIPEIDVIIDFKTGRIRSYREQMAAYCLAMMNRSKGDLFMKPSDQYTAYCVFVDQQQIERYVFTEEEARACLRAVIDATVAPSPCEYCSWCKHFETCPMTKKAVQEVVDLAAQLPKATPAALTSGQLPAVLEELYDDHEAAAQILDALDRATKWVKLFKSGIKKRLNDGGSSTVFRLTKETASKKVMPLKLGQFMREWGTDAILSLFEPIPVSKFSPTWKKFNGEKPVPDDLITEEKGERQLRRVPAKKDTTK